MTFSSISSFNLSNFKFLVNLFLRDNHQNEVVKIDFKFSKVIDFEIEPVFRGQGVSLLLAGSREEHWVRLSSRL